MTTTLLTGLRPNNPLAVMAAYGVLRLLPGSRLRWAGAHPELDVAVEPIEALKELLPARLKAPEVTLFDDPRKIDDYETVAKALPSEWQLPTAAQGQEGCARTNLLLLSGAHKFVENARQIMKTLLAQDVAEKLREALFGPWRYDDKDLQAWGWDAGARIDTASSSKDGANTPKYGVSGASWLAWEGLPLWPLINGRTLGWRSGLTYPTCVEWLGWHELRAVVLGLGTMPPREQTALGIQIWHAPRIATSQYGGLLGWGRVVTRTQSDRRNVAGSRNL